MAVRDIGLRLAVAIGRPQGPDPRLEVWLTKLEDPITFDSDSINPL